MPVLVSMFGRSRWPCGNLWSHCIRLWPISYTGVLGGPIGLPRSAVRVVILHTLLRPSSRQFLMGLRVECIKMEGQLLLLENPLLKVLLLEDERSDWVNPIFEEREKCGEFHSWFPMLLEQAQKNFVHYFRMGPDTFWYILHNINFLEFLRINHFLLI